MVARARCVNGDGVGLHGWRGGIIDFVREVKLTRNLTCQSDPWLQISVRIPIPQVTEGSRSADHTWVRYCNRNFNSTIYPPSYVQKGFVHFCCHGLPQLREYDQGLPTQHSIDINNKHFKTIPLIVTVLTVIVFIDSFTAIQELCHWIILVEIWVLLW